MSRARFVLGLRIFATLLLMSVCALSMLAVAAVTLFRLRRFYSERIAAPFAKLVLKLWGIRIRLHTLSPFPAGQAVYISNHTSTIDLFALLALGLPNARFFLSGYLRKLLPLGLIGYLIGIFWTVPQTFPERRREIFRCAANTLQRSKESVYLSPEGERITTGEIGHFNKGAFHLALSLRAPIVPLFIAIPPAINPGRGLAAAPGIIDVYVHEAIPTGDWQLADLLAHKEAVRQRFVEWHRACQSGAAA
ncbi:MAG: lysophospholipid acyltransferase family protein [Sideroxydans sp.]|nr:lysophospholipid acyltransferase family protein [Sideroxydans sp.]